MTSKNNIHVKGVVKKHLRTVKENKQGTKKDAVFIEVRVGQTTETPIVRNVWGIGIFREEITVRFEEGIIERGNVVVGFISS